MNETLEQKLQAFSATEKLDAIIRHIDEESNETDKGHLTVKDLTDMQDVFRISDLAKFYEIGAVKLRKSMQNNNCKTFSIGGTYSVFKEDFIEYLNEIKK